MTTDITALAQSLKAAAEKAKHAGEAPIMSFDARISALNEYQITACPDNVLALVEVLENANRYIEILREWNAGLAQESCERQQRISELLEGKVGNALLERENHHVELVGKLAERIAELESRTVKLPQRHSMLLREDFNEDYHTEMAYKADEVQASLAAAGIKVEDE